MKHASVNEVENAEQPMQAVRRILWKKDANMNTKLYLALVAALCLTFIIYSPALAEKSYLAERLNVSIAVQPDGMLNISETIHEFTFMYQVRGVIRQDAAADTTVDSTVSFPRQSLVFQPPAWQTEKQLEAQRATMGITFGLGAAALTTLLVVVGVIMAGRSFRREAAISQNNIYQNIIAPPRVIPPAQAAKLTGSSVPFLGALFDLARRGVLRIDEGPKKWGNRTFEVIRQPTSERLQPHELVFLAALFKKAKDDRTALSEIASLAYNGQFSRALDRELTVAGLRDAERSSRRGREPVTSPDLFKRYLPYAAGLEDGSFIAMMAAISAADSSASVATSADGGDSSGAG
jgi:hypothetical protein